MLFKSETYEVIIEISAVEVEAEESTASVRQSRFQRSELYSRPQSINNSKICNYCPVTGQWSLHSQAQRIYDYIIINAKGWRHLKAWYGCDFDVIVQKEARDYATDTSRTSM